MNGFAQYFFGLQRSLGWRFALILWVASVFWLPVRTFVMGCSEILAAVAFF
jgi:hypothetical protein